ncbi:MAG: hypothetical protein KKH12_16050 [Gammaproteobacteria bacterium]|nr:hypothetical protein [Gammaproteobacteria bacterium]
MSATQLKGLLVPLQRDGARNYAEVDGERLLASQIRQVIGVQRGELPWRTTFGSDTDQLRFLNNDEAMAQRARYMVKRALAAWLPKVKIFEVTAERVDTALTISIRYAGLNGAPKTTSVELSTVGQ